MPIVTSLRIATGSQYTARLVFLFVTLFTLPAFSTNDFHTPTVHGVEPTTKMVTLIVDYGDGVQKRFTALEWREGVTILNLLQDAAKHPRGIRFEHQGQGETALLLKIDDLKNEGKGRNWLYHVNDKLGDRSFALVKLVPNDVVLWKFKEYR